MHTPRRAGAEREALSAAGVEWPGRRALAALAMPQDSKTIDLYGGIALGIATLAALAVANSPLAPQYRALLDATGEIRVGSVGLGKSLEHWINDGLMAIFFLLVALEIKREAVGGALAGVEKAALPVIAAAGGF